MKYKLFILFLILNSLIFSQNFSLVDSTFKVNDKLISQNILFEFAKFELNQSSLKHLDSIVQFLKIHDSISMEIGVHCDERSPDYSSTQLTVRRARSIRSYLISKGIQTNRLTSIGFEKTKPIIVNAKTEEEHQINRRTEFIIK